MQYIQILNFHSEILVNRVTRFVATLINLPKGLIDKIPILLLELVSRTYLSRTVACFQTSSHRIHHKLVLYCIKIISCE